MQELIGALIPLVLILALFFVILFPVYLLLRRLGIWKGLFILLWVVISTILVKYIFSLVWIDSALLIAIYYITLAPIWWFGGKLIVKWYDDRFKKDLPPLNDT